MDGHAEDVQSAKRSLRGRPKVKTGCRTCRIRKVKCDEAKPFCKKCVSTGRACDGYDSVFRFAGSQNALFAFRSEADLALVSAGLPGIASRDIERLNHCFTIKTMLGITLGCGYEAKQLLEAGLSDPVVHHGILSLRALRDSLDATGGGKTAVSAGAPNYDYGIRQYGLALGGLASGISFQDAGKLKSTLLCCQIFISIEQLLGNYDAMAQHIVRGLMILHEYRPRPTIDCSEELLPAYREQLPLLDVFIVKLFAAPCKFADTAKTGIPPTQQPGSPSHRALAPNMRTEIARISLEVLELLDETAQVQWLGAARRLRDRKGALLRSLSSWFANLKAVHAEAGSSDDEPISVSFLRLFFHILQIVLLSTLDSSPENRLRLGTESDKLQSIANTVGQRVRGYIAASVTKPSAS